MNINQKVNQNFKDIVLVCIKAYEVSGKHITSSTFFNNIKEDKYKDILSDFSWIKCSKRMRKESNSPRYLKNEML